MNHCDCSCCHWGSDLPDKKIYCYSDGHTHDPQDCCKKYLEPCRIDPMTGVPFKKGVIND